MQCREEHERMAGERMVLAIKEVEYPFRWCPSGTFMMGSPTNEEGRQDNEVQHHVRLTRGFWMLETLVTQAMWNSVNENNPIEFKGNGKLPVEFMSWLDCQEYIQQLNDIGVALSGYCFSLPTEAQWEYACRAGTTTPFHIGMFLDRDQANFDSIDWDAISAAESRYGMSISVRPRTSEVGSYPANAWGLYDMHGNLWECCADWYGNYPNGSVVDPLLASSSDPCCVNIGEWLTDKIGYCRSASSDTCRVIRGGSYQYKAEYCRSAYRIPCCGTPPSNEVGLRLSLTEW